MNTNPQHILKTIKLCTHCNQIKPISEFYKNHTQGGYQSRCKSCKIKSLSQRFHNLTPEQRIQLNLRRKKLNSKYGLKRRLRNHRMTLNQYQTMFDSQQGLCGICSQPESAKHQKGTIKSLAIDHDHKTNQVRGLLCSRCNLLLGYAKDSISLLKKCIIYLESHQTTELSG